MNDAEIRSICTERLSRWTERLVENHSTPIVLVGVGHDNHEGEVHICTTEERTDEDILLFLLGAQDQLERKIIAEKGRR